jgi:dTDP-4-dehydrorhamnose 3,5-epimerase
MQITALESPDVLLLTPRRFGDSRGWFCESWNAQRMAAAGLAFEFCQDNHSFSRDPGTLRGLHYQAPPFAQTKLVRCTHGAIFDVAVDARAGSPGYGRWCGAELSAANGRQLLIPKGFLHGFLTLSADTEVQYKVDAVYDRDSDGCVAWDDPGLGIAWPLGKAGVGAPILSEKDADAPGFSQFVSPFVSPFGG